MAEQSAAALAGLRMQARDPLVGLIERRNAWRRWIAAAEDAGIPYEAIEQIGWHLAALEAEIFHTPPETLEGAVGLLRFVLEAHGDDRWDALDENIDSLCQSLEAFLKGEISKRALPDVHATAAAD